MKIKEILFGISIIILILFVVIAGIDTFYPKPLSKDYCLNSDVLSISINSSFDCNQLGGKWTFYEGFSKNGRIGNCDINFYCSEKYQSARGKYLENRFFLGFFIGIILIFLGVFYFNVEFIGAGFMGAGIGIFLLGLDDYWSHSENWSKFFIFSIGFIFIIFCAYRFNKKSVK